jgi:hypothetical protein
MLSYQYYLSSCGPGTVFMGDQASYLTQARSIDSLIQEKASPASQGGNDRPEASLYSTRILASPNREAKRLCDCCDALALLSISLPWEYFTPYLHDCPFTSCLCAYHQTAFNTLYKNTSSKTFQSIWNIITCKIKKERCPAPVPSAFLRDNQRLQIRVF